MTRHGHPAEKGCGLCNEVQPCHRPPAGEEKIPRSGTQPIGYLIQGGTCVQGGGGINSHEVEVEGTWKEGKGSLWSRGGYSPGLLSRVKKEPAGLNLGLDHSLGTLNLSPHLDISSPQDQQHLRASHLLVVGCGMQRCTASRVDRQRCRCPGCEEPSG